MPPEVAANTATPTNTAVNNTAPVETPEAAPENQEALDTEETKLADPNLSTKQKAEIKKRIKEIKLKVDGKEFRESLPFEIDESPEAIDYLTRQLQMAKMGSKRAQDYSSLQKNVQTFIEELKKNPRKVLNDPELGIDFKQVVKDFIEEEVAKSQKSPEQIEKEELEGKLRDLEDQRKKEKQEWEAREMERLQEQAAERYDIQISNALTKSDLPQTPYVIKKITEFMMLGLQNGVDVSADDVIPLVREEMHNDLKQMFSVMPEELIEKIVGKDVIGKIRKKSIAKAKAANPINKTVKDVGVTAKPTKESAKKMSYKDFFGI